MFLLSCYRNKVDDCRQSPSLLFLSFADEDYWKVILDRPNHPISEREAENRIETMELRLNSRCKGLLEALHRTSNFEDQEADQKPNFWESSTVQYLHRTIKDYVEIPIVKSLFNSYLKSPFDPNLKL
jgi:hypothetical protein